MWRCGAYLVGAVVAIMMSSAAVQAATTLDVQGGRLLGAFKVPVNGALFDVRFKDDSCVTEFNGCNDPSDFAFNSQADATAAAQALLDRVFVGNFDTDPTATFGCGNPDFCSAAVPFGLINGSVIVAFAQNFAVEASDTTFAPFNFPIGTSAGNDTNTFNTAVYAVFSTHIPEPATISLLGAGLAGIGFVAWRKRRKTAA